MCAPINVGAIDPVGMTNASTMNARNTNARMNATRIDSIVSLTLPSWCWGLGVDGAAPAAVLAGEGLSSGIDGLSYAAADGRGRARRGEAGARAGSNKRKLSFA